MGAVVRGDASAQWPDVNLVLFLGIALVFSDEVPY